MDAEMLCVLCSDATKAHSKDVWPQVHQCIIQAYHIIVHGCFPDSLIIHQSVLNILWPFLSPGHFRKFMSAKWWRECAFSGGVGGGTVTCNLFWSRTRPGWMLVILPKWREGQGWGEYTKGSNEWVQCINVIPDFEGDLMPIVCLRCNKGFSEYYWAWVYYSQAMYSVRLYWSYVIWAKIGFGSDDVVWLM